MNYPSDIEMHFGLMAVPNLSLRFPDLETDNLYPLSFWEYEELVNYYCQSRIEEYLNTDRGNNDAKSIHTES